MMAEFTWIEKSLFLMFLHAAATRQFVPSRTVRAGDEVTLHCDHVMNDQSECTDAFWTFSAPTVSLLLVRDGQISKIAKSKADRLNVTQDCSLVIKKVADEDAGHYDCKQHWSSDTYLFVVNISEEKDADMVTLNCSVSTLGKCVHTVRWVQAPNGRDLGVQRSQSLCSASLTYRPSSMLTSLDNFFTCEVTDGNKQRQEFPFRRQSSGEDATTATTKPTEATTELSTATGCSVIDYLMLVLRVAELVLITVITVLLVRAQRKQRPPDHNPVHHGGDAVNYENVGEPSASIGFNADINQPEKQGRRY